MVVVPTLTPVTIPEDEPIVAAAVLLLQVPPVVPSIKVVPDPMQVPGLPLMGNGVTVSVTVAVQPTGEV